MRRYRNRDRPEVEQWDTWNKRRSQLAWRGREKGGNDWALGPPFSKTALLRTLPCHLLSPSSILLSPYSSSHLNLSSFSSVPTLPLIWTFLHSPTHTSPPHLPTTSEHVDFPPIVLLLLPLLPFLYFLCSCGLSSYSLSSTSHSIWPCGRTFLLLPLLTFLLYQTTWDFPPTHLRTPSHHVNFPPTHLPTPSDHVDFPPTHPSTFLLYQTTWDLPPTPPFKPIHTTHLLGHGQFRRFCWILAEAGAENFCHLIFFYN